MRVPAYSYPKRPVAGKAVINGRGATPRDWNSLEELQECVLSRGCTPAQFKYAVEVMGADPHRVAGYLQRHAFIAALAAQNVEMA